MLCGSSVFGYIEICGGYDYHKGQLCNSNKRENGIDAVHINDIVGNFNKMSFELRQSNLIIKGC